jgi:hypothetical protein
MFTSHLSRIDTAGPALRFGDAPSGPASREPRESSTDLDDLGWDVPDEDGDATRDDENFDPDDDSDLELDDDADEAVGLDTDTGFEESDELELDESGEDERWTTDSEPLDELPGGDGEMITGGEEYGWIGDDEPADADDDLDEDGMEDEPLASLDDGGAEGVEDDTDLDDFELGKMPDLDAAAEEEAEGFVTENIEELAGVNLADELSVELVPGNPWKQLPARAAQVTRGASLPGPALAFAVLGKTIALAAGDGWFRAAARGGLTRLPVDAPPGRSLALADYEGRTAFALASPAGLFVSLDGGRSFELHREADPPVQVALTESAGVFKLWARNAKGQLSVSEDLGKSWSPQRLDGGSGNVLAFATDGERRLSAVVKRASRIALGSSSDSGRRWSWVDAADSGNDPTLQLLPGRGVIALAQRGRLSHAQPGQPARVLAPLLSAPAALADEDDETFVYACVPHEDQILIVRTALRAGAQPMVVTSLARERTGEPRFLSAAYAEGGFVTLNVATDQALLRIEASLDGDDLP